MCVVSRPLSLAQDEHVVEQFVASKQSLVLKRAMDWKVDHQALAKVASEFAEQIHTKRTPWEDVCQKKYPDRADCKKVTVRKNMSGMMALEWESEERASLETLTQATICALSEGYWIPPAALKLTSQPIREGVLQMTVHVRKIKSWVEDSADYDEMQDPESWYWRTKSQMASVPEARKENL